MEMETLLCLICGRNADRQFEDVATRTSYNKFVFDCCFRLFKIELKSYKEPFKWKWNSQYDSPNFCELCGSNIKILSQLFDNLIMMQEERKRAVVQTQITILNSTPNNKRKRTKYYSAMIPFDSLSVIDKIDYFRSVAVQVWTPKISLKRCDEKKETNGIIDVGGHEISITKEQWGHYFYDVDEKFQCKICFSIIKERRNAQRHVNEKHRRIYRFKCKFCPMKFITKSTCKSHLRKKHKKKLLVPKKPIPLVSSSKTRYKVKCILCYKPVNDVKVQISSEVLNSLSSLLKFNPPKYMLEFAISCVGCSTYLTDLHNLKCNLEQIENEFGKLLRKVKTELLESIFQSEIDKIPDDNPRTPEDVPFAKKMEYFRRLAVKDFTPKICLFKIQLEPVTPLRTPAKNSVFNLVKDDEIIVLKASDHLFPSANEELMNFFQNDGEKYICLICDNFLTSYKTYKCAINHYNKRHLQIKRFQCKYCAEAFYDRHECAYHIVTLHNLERVEIATKIGIKLNSQSAAITTTDGVIALNTPKLLRSKDDIIKLEDGSYKCSICSKVYSRRAVVSVHQKKVHLRMYRFKCEFCNFKNHHKHTVLYHVRRVHPDKQKLINATNNVKGPPPFLIRTLSKPRVKRCVDPSLVRGMKVLETKIDCQTEEHFRVLGSQYSCKICGRAFTHRNRAIGHIETVHFGVRKYQCGECTKKFYSLSSCKRHMRKFHPNYLERLEEIESRNNNDCSDYKIIPKVHLEDKQAMVIGDMKYGVSLDAENSPLKVTAETNNDFPECSIDIEGPFVYKTENYTEISDKDCFNSTTDIVNVHYNVKDEFSSCLKTDIPSTESPKNEKLKEGLNENKKLPSDKFLLYKYVQPGEILEVRKGPNYEANRRNGCKKLPDGGYKCLKCSKYFKNLRIFQQHWGVIHDKSGGYQCSGCQRRFYSKFHCAQHFITKHTNRNPFVCPTCDQSFNTNTCLKKHIQRHMSERRFACSLCPLKFIDALRLTRHNQNVHMKILGL